ncbi:helix-turn-helix domain-containing protein [Xanthomonas hortorum pv. gardneri]|uniref:DNA-3-methyladenine glycosylase 2 n=1 Tax=Xanthomonas hortorum TaxID=56454 RepID=UPI002FDF6F14
MQTATPDRIQCDRARLARDARFDGLFFTAVRSTGIYCRPVCPAPPPKPGNISYYATAAAASAAGYRPCLRCRPELSPQAQQHLGEESVQRALAMIVEGALQEQPVQTLADAVGLSARQLQRQFVQQLGATPIQVHGTRRLLLAKQLLTETALPVTEVALAAGFNSLRHFKAIPAAWHTQAGAATLAARLVERHGGHHVDMPPGLDRIFPTPEQLAEAPLEYLGLPRARAATLRALASACAQGRLHFGAGQRLPEFVAACTALPGIGPWTAQYVAMRALSHPDAFPAGDLILQQVLGTPERLSERATEARSRAWRPWRAYAVLHLWHLAVDRKDTRS